VGDGIVYGQYVGRLEKPCGPKTAHSGVGDNQEGQDIEEKKGGGCPLSLGKSWLVKGTTNYKKEDKLNHHFASVNLFYDII
jgi:hypothetical protein